LKAHDLGHELLDGPDVPAVVPTYDDQDREQHVEVRTTEPLPECDSWYDTNSTPRQDPAVEVTIADDGPQTQDPAERKETQLRATADPL
jgi:hypothetical protein